MGEYMLWLYDFQGSTFTQQRGSNKRKGIRKHCNIPSISEKKKKKKKATTSWENRILPAS
jgi:hypothetical protein